MTATDEDQAQPHFCQKQAKVDGPVTSNRAESSHTTALMNANDPDRIMSSENHEQENSSAIVGSLSTPVALFSSTTRNQSQGQVTRQEAPDIATDAESRHRSTEDGHSSVTTVASTFVCPERSQEENNVNNMEINNSTNTANASVGNDKKIATTSNNSSQKKSSIPITAGRWTRLEHDAFLVGLSIFGTYIIHLISVFLCFLPLV